MIAHRRVTWNYSLQAAAEAANKLGKPLIIFEALRIGIKWSSPRFHQFVIQGMRDTAESCASTHAFYFPYVEERAGHGKGLLNTLAKSACQVFTDEFPCFFLPNMVRSAASNLSVRLTQVDSNGILPLRATDRHFTTAFSFRRHLQKTLPRHLTEFPLASPLDTLNKPLDPHLLLPVQSIWPAAEPQRLLQGSLESLALKSNVPPAPDEGGSCEAQRRLSDFLQLKMHRYHIDRNATENGSASGLSPYLHFGHISAHEIVSRIWQSCSWTPDNIGLKTTGSRTGWWGLPDYAETALDQLITWRELGYVFNFHNPNDYDRFESLPPWAKETMNIHRSDPRPTVYSFEELDNAATHDPLWNAAQQQLRHEGRIHNYLRMLWGKKIYQWSPSPEIALENLIELNNTYALDGRNPNSYSGICWILGRFDRAWGPERPIFGKLRYMTSESTARKLKVKAYMKRYRVPQNT